MASQSQAALGGDLRGSAGTLRRPPVYANDAIFQHSGPFPAPISFLRLTRNRPEISCDSSRTTLTTVRLARQVLVIGFWEFLCHCMLGDSVIIQIRSIEPELWTWVTHELMT
jgi:hypothetical protein